MTVAWTVTTQADLRRAMQNVALAGYMEPEEDEDTGLFMLKPERLLMWEGEVVMDESGGVMVWCVEREGSDFAPCTWIRYVYPAIRFTPELVRECCYSIIRRGLQHLPNYRVVADYHKQPPQGFDPTATPEECQWLMATFEESDHVLTKGGGRFIAKTSPKRMLELVKAYGLDVDASALARCR